MNARFVKTVVLLSIILLVANLNSQVNLESKNSTLQVQDSLDAVNKDLDIVLVIGWYDVVTKSLFKSSQKTQDPTENIVSSFKKANFNIVQTYFQYLGKSQINHKMSLNYNPPPDISYDANISIIYHEDSYQGKVYNCNIKVKNPQDEILLEYNTAMYEEVKYYLHYKGKPDLDYLGDDIYNFLKNNIAPIGHLLMGLKDNFINQIAAQRLGRSNDPRAISALIEVLFDENERNKWNGISDDAAESLGKTKNPEVVDTLIFALNGASEYLRASITEALGDIGGEKALKWLIELTKDETSMVRKRAAVSLGKIGNKDAIEPLKKLLQDESKYVREAAQESLDKLKEK
ncbi:MAG: HEAT repeat domain-containing protein [Ignavibacteria bacterium]|jgi:hypothetical protein